LVDEFDDVVDLHVLNIIDEELDFTSTYEHGFQKNITIHEFRNLSDSVLFTVADKNALQNLRRHSSNVPGVHFGQLIDTIRKLLWILSLRIRKLFFREALHDQIYQFGGVLGYLVAEFLFLGLLMRLEVQDAKQLVT